MARSGINRGFTWLRKVLRITEETESPSVLSEIVRPTMDVFGWERLAEVDPSGVETATGTLATDIVVLDPVPEGVARFVIYASGSHNDPATLLLSLQVRGSGVDIAITSQITPVGPTPMRLGIERNILLQPGEQLILRSSGAPAAGTGLFIRMKFVDLDPGEYLPAL